MSKKLIPLKERSVDYQLGHKAGCANGKRLGIKTGGMPLVQLMSNNDRISREVNTKVRWAEVHEKDRIFKIFDKFDFDSCGVLNPPLLKLKLKQAIDPNGY